MAKKKGSNLAVPSTDSYKPQLYLDLQGKDIKQLDGIKIGAEVEVIVRGTVKRVSQEQRQDYDDPKKSVTTGSIALSDYELVLVEDEANEFSDLAEDDA